MADVVDVAVVGAGPAGLAAAITAAAAGLRVAVVDAGSQLGGQYWRHPDENTPGVDEARGQHDWNRFTALRERFNAFDRQGLIRHLAGTDVWFAEPPPGPGGDFVLRLRAVSDPPITPGRDGLDKPGNGLTGDGELDIPRVVRARRLILCPGGYDRQLPVSGWDLPGVMTAGGIQALWKGHRSLAGRRAVVAGTGPFLLPVAAGLVDAGVEVAAICEAGNLSGWLRHLPGVVQVPSKGIEGVDYVRKLLGHRVRYRPTTVVTAIHGDRAVQSVTLSRVDASGRALRGSEQTLAVDLVGLGWGFTPSLELVVAVGAKTRRDVDESLVAVVDDDQRSTVPGVYIAGEATGVGGARLAVYEGELAALTLVGDRGQTPSASRQRQLRRAIRRARAFARAMHLAHPIPRNWPEWLAPDTTICRCEEVDYAAVCRARDELGAVDARMVKLLARTGMGWCQGRVCGFATSQLAAAHSGREVTSAELRSMSKRPFAVPVSLGELADLDEA